MTSLRTFIRKISDAAFKPHTYSAHLKERTSTGLGYLYWLLVCSFTVTAIVLAGLYVPARVGIRAVANGSEPQLRSLFPEKLVLTMHSGSLSTNQKEPYVIDPPFWAAMKMKNHDGTTPAHFMTIATKAKIDDFAKYDSAVLLTRTYAVSESDGQLKSFPFSKIQKDFMLNKDTYNAIVTKAMPIIHAVPHWIDVAVIIGLILLPFVGAGFSWAWHLFTLLGWSLIFWGVSYFMGKNLRYGQIYRLGLYALTLPLLISTILGFLPLFGPTASNAVFLIFMIFVLRAIPSPTMPATKTVKKAAKAPKKAAASRKKAK